jgi:hypothetical protein
MNAEPSQLLFKSPEGVAAILKAARRFVKDEVLIWVDVSLSIRPIHYAALFERLDALTSGQYRR